MATTSKNIIHLLGNPIYNEDGAAAEVITPGMLVLGVASLIKNNVADLPCSVAVAHERDEMNKSIDDNYAIGDTVKVGTYKAGERFLGIILSGVVVTEGAFLASAGNGTLKLGTAATAIGRSMEALTAAATGNTRIRVEAI
jgi:hypothetical protein